MIDSELNGDNNMVNLYNSRLKDIQFDEKLTRTREQLNQWRSECHKTIEEFYERKLEELNSSIDEFRTKYEEKRTKVQTNISQLNDQENFDLKKPIIHSIEQDLNEIEQITLQIQFRSLTINDNYVHIDKEFHLTNLTNESSTSFLYSTESSSAIASNEQVLLMHQYPYLSLINQDSKIVKQSFWPYGWIRDICWSKTTHCFILITTNNIYFVDENLQSCPLMKDDIKQSWFSSTCSEEFLYLSTCQWGSSIFQFSLTSPIDFIKQWESPLTCADYEGIDDIKYNNQTLALMIRDPKDRKKRMELKTIETFSTIWSLELSLGANIRLFTCCPISFNEWLIIDGTNSHIYQVTKDGKFKENIHYNSIPYRANMFSSNILAISAELDLNLRPI